jgi:hypothetical protein
MNKGPCYENAARLSGVSRYLLELPPFAMVGLLTQADRRLISRLSNIAQQFIPGCPIISAEFKNLPGARSYQYLL